MSGRKQHHIPQILLRGFTSQSNSGQHVWVHRSKPPSSHSVSIKDAAAERDFYSDQPVSSEETVDDFITGLESDLAVSIAGIRSQPAGSPIDPSIPSRALTHLYLRSASLRSMMSDGYLDIHQALLDWVQSGDFLPAYFGLDKTYASPRFKELLKALESHPKIGFAISALRQGKGRAKADLAVFTFVRSNLLALGKQAETDLIKQIEIMGISGLEWARESHGEAIRSRLDKEALAGLEELKWTVESIASTPLPDTIAVATRDGLIFDPLPWVKADERRMVVFPVSSDQIAIGRSDPDLATPSDFAEIMIAASDHFSVTDGPSLIVNTHELIGTRKRALFAEVVASSKRKIFQQPLARHFEDRERQ